MAGAAAGAAAGAREEGVKVILLDIEGTVCPISFVKDVLFPYALQSLGDLLSSPSGWDSPSFVPYRDAFPAEHRSTPSALLAHVRDLVQRDVKIAYLKSLQGHLWLRGYESGALKCALFPDVSAAFQRWRAAGLSIQIYSSGSVPAQKLLFQYTTEGDLRPNIDAWFDTVNAGMKMERASYETIIRAGRDGLDGSPVGRPAHEHLFFSDRVEEVVAARAAGMRSRLVVRDGNAPVAESVMAELGAVKAFSPEEVLVNGV